MAFTQATLRTRLVAAARGVPGVKVGRQSWGALPHRSIFH